MSATKNEKQLMDEKVAKVREVVHNVSRNDIVLALHNFDMDVERTINAFCSGGAESALGDWEKTSAAGKKKQQKKKKTPEASTVSSVSSANNISPSKPVSVARAAPPPASAPSTASQSSLNGSINGYSTTTAVAVPKPQQNGVAKPTKTAPLKNGTSHAPSPKKAQEPTRSTTKSSNAAVTASGTAGTTISHYFQELRRALDDRERQLLSEVAHDGSESRFVADTSKLLQAIARFGEVESAKPNAFSPQQNQATIDIIKHSNSHSSLVSSVGEDSGLGQTSPVSREKSTTQVVSSGGGIVMQSDALSEEQLADLQRRIEETLKAQGIDPSVLSEIGSGAAPRRRPPQKKPPRKDQRADKGRHQPQVELSILQ